MEPDDLRDGGDQYSSFEPTVLRANTPGQTFTVRMRLLTKGVNDPGAIRIHFYASTDTSITDADYYLGRVNLQVSAGTWPTVTMLGAFPTNIPEGAYYVGWIIDPDNRFAEDDETNNTAYKSAPLLRVVNPLQSAIYVDIHAKGANNGTSWENAFTNLQSALLVAVPGREIRVADGVYTPDAVAGILSNPSGQTPGGGCGGSALIQLAEAVAGDREATFLLRGGMILRGGYAGAGAPDPNARDVQVYATILSGDLKANDLPVADPCNLWKEPSRADNSRHILTALKLDQMAVLDGFQIVGGCAFGPSPTPFTDDLQGAGLTMSGGSLSLRNCTFLGNWAASDGGAIYLDDGRLELVDCIFRANGAGRMVTTPSDMSISGNFKGMPLIQGTGGAIRNNGTGQLVLSGCGFYYNFAGKQGGALANEQGRATLTRCSFIQNRGVNSGGGAISNDEGPLDAVSCTFNGNSSDYSGGAISNGSAGRLNVANCSLHANRSKLQAGAIDIFFGGKVTLSNCTLAANGPKAIACGPMIDDQICELTIANSILWDGGNEISSPAGALVKITRSDVQGGWSGTGNLNANPLFVLPAGRDALAGTEDDDLRLGPGSPCLDRGDNTLLPQDVADLDGDNDLKERLPFDLDGNARIGGAAVDMGAYEQ